MLTDAGMLARCTCWCIWLHACRDSCRHAGQAAAMTLWWWLQALVGHQHLLMPVLPCCCRVVKVQVKKYIPLDL